MDLSNQIILVGGVLSLLAVFAGIASVRLGAPLLLGLIVVGMLAGEDGPGGIPFDDFHAAYLIGSVALAVILFEGGISTQRGMLKRALWPSISLATTGVALSALIVAAAARLLLHAPWPEGLLLGAAIAPTDAAAVSVQLRVSQVAVPARVVAALELESGLNDPMSVFLTLALIAFMRHADSFSFGRELLTFAWEMGGGAVIGLGAGYVLMRLFRRLETVESVFPVLALGVVLVVFGGAQMVGASGFLASYLAGVMVGNSEHPGAEPVTRFFETLGWVAQNALFLMLGLLVTPHRLLPLLGAAALIAAVLVLVARPISVGVSLAPFRWSVREMTFISWAGLRGAVPIYLTIIPLLEGVGGGQRLFDIVFVAVIISVALQGPTLNAAARILGLRGEARLEH